MGKPFQGIEVYCYTCGKYMIVELETEVKECYYCKGTWIRNDILVDYKYV